MRDSCEDQYDAINCGAAVQFCRSVYSQPYRDTGLSWSTYIVGKISFDILLGRNPYDISKPCEGKIEETLCYPQTKYLQLQFLVKSY